jgi:hypothetical protein
MSMLREKCLAIDHIYEHGREIDRFKNKHGEEFLVYRLNNDDLNYYVTGDELDWELSWYFDPVLCVLMRTFILGDDELSGIEKLIKEYKE